MKPKSDPAELRRTFERHRAEPDLSPADYLRWLRIELGESLISRWAVYLDTKYWIYLRDAHLERPQHHTHPELLERLVELVMAGKAFCPLSATTFVEISRHSPPGTAMDLDPYLGYSALSVSTGSMVAARRAGR